MGLLRAREMVLIIGPCGVGKTTYARDHYPLHAHPDLERLMATLSADGRLHYAPQFRAASRRMLVAAVDDLLARGVAVCVTESGATRRERGRWLALARQRGAPVSVIRLRAPSFDVCVERAMRDLTRPATARGAWPDIIRNWDNRWEPVDVAAEGITSYVEVDVA